MTTNGTVQVNDTLAVFIEGDHISIGREDGGLVSIQVDEIKPMMESIGRAIITVWSDGPTIDDMAQANVLATVLDSAWALYNENEHLTTRLAEQTERAELWKQAAEAEHSERVRVPVVGALSAKTTPEDFKRFCGETS